MFIDSFLLFLSNHQSSLYVILFLGAFFETLIGTSFFIYGELFFLAGSILAGMGQANLILIMFVLYGGSLLGDHASYWVGRKWGDSVYYFFKDKFFFRRFFTIRNYERGTRFFSTYGGWTVFIGRFLGPVSWITPFLTGVFKLSYLRFTIFDFPGVILGVGQFIVVGYIFGKNYKIVLAFVQQYLLIVIFLLICTLFILYRYKRVLKRLDMTIRHSILHYVQSLRTGNKSVIRKSIKNISLFAGVIVIFYIVILITIFFIENKRLNGIIEPDFQNNFTSSDEIIKSIDSSTYYKNGTSDVGPINVIVVTNKSLDSVLTKSGFVKTKTFIRDTVGLVSYIKEAKRNVLPVSDLYFKGIPQNYAYKYATSTLRSRIHARVWNYGKLNGVPVYIISVSKDLGFDFYRNLSFLVLFHALDSNIDTSRDMLANSILEDNSVKAQTLRKSKLVKEAGESAEDPLYYTDGLIWMIYI